MKKLLLIGALIGSMGIASAQKFARVDYQGILPLMPEMTGVQTELNKVRTDYMEHLESLSVERNKMMDEMSKLPEGTSETTKQLKQREILNINQRIEEYYQVAEEGISKAQMDLLLPLKTKLDAAVAKICKAQGITAAYQTIAKEAFPGELVYIDPSTADITMAVRKELGIAENAVAPTAPAPAAAAAGK